MTFNSFPLPKPRDQRVSPAKLVAMVSRGLGLLLWLLSAPSLAMELKDFTLTPAGGHYLRTQALLTAKAQFTEASLTPGVKFEWYKPGGALFHTDYDYLWDLDGGVNRMGSSSIYVQEGGPGIRLGDWSVAVFVQNDQGTGWSTTPLQTLTFTVSNDPPYAYQNYLSTKLTTNEAETKSDFYTQDPQQVFNTDFLYYTHPSHWQTDYFYHYSPAVRQWWGAHGYMLPPRVRISRFHGDSTDQFPPKEFLKWTAITTAPRDHWSRLPGQWEIAFHLAPGTAAFAEPPQSTLWFTLHDNTPPVLTLKPLPSLVTRQARLTLTGKAEDNAGYENIVRAGVTEIQWQSTAKAPDGSPLLQSGQTRQLTEVYSTTTADGKPGYLMSWQLPPRAAPNTEGLLLRTGNNQIQLTAVDQAGNRSAPVTLTVQFLNDPPKVEALTAPLWVRNGQSYTIAAQLQDVNDNLKQWEVNWGEEQTTTKTLTAGQTQQAQVTASHVYSSPLPPDLLPTEVSWTVTARDEEELTDTVTWTVPYLDATAEDNQCFNPTLTVRYTGDPIDVATGAQRLEEDWLSLPGGLPLTFHLRYHSLLLRDGVFGRGWEDPTYQARLRFLPQGGVLVQWSNNRYNLFERQADGSYRATHGSCRFDSLVQTATGGFTLTRNGSLVYQFDTHGLLTELGNAQGQVLQMSYDSQSHLTQMTDPVTGHYLLYSYNSENLVTVVSDSAGRSVQLGYDSQRHLTSITDAVGQTTTYTYNDHSQLLTATDAAGSQRFRNTYDDHYRIASQDDGRPETPPLQFRYDDSTPNQRTTTVADRAGQTRVYVTRRSDFQLLSLRDELGGVTSFSYDTNGKLLSQTNPLGQTTRYEYDGQGNLVKAIDPTGAMTTLTYDDAHQPLTVTNALGQQVRLRYDSQHHLVSQTDPLKQVTTYTYNDAGQVQTHTSAGGGVTRYDYTAGQLTQVTLPEGHSYQLGYDEAGRVVSLQDPDGQTTTLTYDAANRLLALTNALGHPVQLGYDGRDNLLYWQDANGNLTQRQYDGNGNLRAQTNALNQTTRYDYEAQDHLVKVTDAKGRVTQLHYDAKGRLVGLTNPLGNTQSLEYDAADKLLKQLDSVGQVVAQFNYDTRANLVSQLNALGNEEQLRYDALNRLVEVQDPLKRVTTFNYDALNRLTHSVDALGGNSHQGFDKDGQRDSLTDPNGNQTRFQFDQNGRLVKETLDTGDKVSYTYNARDLLAQVTNARGQSRQLEYDAAGRLVSVTDPEGMVSFTYDNNGNVLTVTDSQGTISRTYDALNRVTSYTDVNGNTLHYEYDEVGNLVALTYPDGKVVHYDYDAADQLIKVTDWAGRVTGYEYDKNGRLLTESRPNGTQMTRRYNVAGQLVQQVEKDNRGELISQFDYSYDAAGNILKEQKLPKPESVSLPAVTMTYSAANRLATYNGPAVQFDADGNLVVGPLAGEMANFSFDSRNRLVAAGETNYRYDAENQRVGVNQTSYIINSQPALSQVLVKEENGVKTFYVYGLGLIGEETGGEYRAYHFDFRGSTVALTDSTGKVMERFQYGPYGELVKGNTTVTPFLFNGKYGVMTDDNGLYYMRARFYSAAMKRFVNQDVLLGNITEGQTLNRYAFVTGQPVSLVDPFGLDREDIFQSIDFLYEYYSVLFQPANGKEVVLALSPLLPFPSRKFGLQGYNIGNIVYIPKCFDTDTLIRDDRLELMDTLTHELLHIYINDIVGGPHASKWYDLVYGKGYESWIEHKAAEIANYYIWRPKGVVPPVLNDYPEVPPFDKAMR